VPPDPTGTVAPVRCPYCQAIDDKVVDSRLTEDGAAIRRRRECLACGRRSTTFERAEELALVVVKRSGVRELFDRQKVETGITRAAKNRPLGVEAIQAMASEIEDQLRLLGPELASDQVGMAVLDRLRLADPVAYLRFASVYKGFEDVTDFEREVVELQKTTAPKTGGTSPAGHDPDVPTGS